MDPKMLEINGLRVLNDYLNQTIDVLVRAQRFGVGGTGIGVTPYTGIGVTPYTGISHSPYAAQAAMYGASPFTPTYASAYTPAIGIDPIQAVGLSHSPYAIPQAGPFGQVVNTTPFTSTYPAMIDPFLAQRGLLHSPATAWYGTWNNTWNPAADIARQQQLQAIAAVYRGYGV